MKYKFIIIVVLSFIISKPAYAYLDPGTGIIIIQAILGFIAAALVSINIWWLKIKTFFLTIFKSDKKKKSDKESNEKYFK